MIFAVFIILILGLFIGFLNILPVAGALSFSFEPAVESIVGFLRAWDWLFPIHELLAYLVIFIGLEIALWTLRQLRSVVKFIRGHTDS